MISMSIPDIAVNHNSNRYLYYFIFRYGFIKEIQNKYKVSSENIETLNNDIDFLYWISRFSYMSSRMVLLLAAS